MIEGLACPQPQKRRFFDEARGEGRCQAEQGTHVRLSESLSVPVRLVASCFEDLARFRISKRPTGLDMPVGPWKFQELLLQPALASVD